MNDDEVIAALNALSTRSKRKRATLIYECTGRKCALLYVFTAHGRRFAHQPRYKLSAEVNQQETVEAARTRHTLDGNRHWKADTFPLSAAAGVLRLECDHCRAQLEVGTIEADVRGATHLPTTIPLHHNQVR